MDTPPNLAQLAATFENLQAQLNQAKGEKIQLSGGLSQENEANSLLRKAKEERETNAKKVS